MKEFARLVVCAFILFSAIAFAKPSPHQSAELIAPVAVIQAQSKQESTAAQAGITKQESELLLIKEQNRLIKEFQSAQQATVYWALGGILSFVLILTGLSILTNFKLYDQDKERLRVEFDGKIAAYRAQFNLQAEEYRRESDQAAEQKSQALQDRLLLQLSELRKSVEGVRSELIGDIKMTDSGIKKFESSLAEVNRKLAEAEADLRDVEAVVWDLKDVPGNIIITHSQGLKAAVQASNKARTSHILNLIISTLEEKYSRPGIDISYKANEWLVKRLDEAVALDPAGVAKVRETLSKIGVKEEVES